MGWVGGWCDTWDAISGIRAFLGGNIGEFDGQVAIPKATPYH